MARRKALKDMTQNERIMAWLERKGAISPIQAWEELGVYRLSARIKELRDQGIVINTLKSSGKNRFDEDIYFASYRLQ